MTWHWKYVSSSVFCEHRFSVWWFSRFVLFSCVFFYFYVGHVAWNKTMIDWTSSLIIVSHVYEAYCLYVFGGVSLVTSCSHLCFMKSRTVVYTWAINARVSRFFLTAPAVMSVSRRIQDKIPPGQNRGFTQFKGNEQSTWRSSCVVSATRSD